MEQSAYPFADRGEEQRRLESQAELFNPLTEGLFLAAGLEPGMRVLDLGSGAGDVALMAARFVGAEGAVVGVERNPDAVVAARARVEQAGVMNVRVVEGDVQTLADLEGGFDAIVGRLVLMYVSNPAATLARAAELLRPGGLLCLHEGDMTYDWAHPMTPLWTQVRSWFLETCERAGIASLVAARNVRSCRSAGAGTAPGVHGERGCRGAGLGLGQRDSRRTAADGAPRCRERCRGAARYARSASPG